MIHTIWNAIIYQPLYNAMAIFVNISPAHSLGIAIVALTVLVKIILYPSSKKSAISQIKMKELALELAQIKKDFPDKKEQATKTMELYKKNKINPFSGFVPILIQIPIIIGLYMVFRSGLDFKNTLYPFVHAPISVNSNFLWIIDLGRKSLVLAVLVGVSQMIQGRLMPKADTGAGVDKNSFQHQMSKSLSIQMKYVLPIFIGFISYSLPSAIALYWLTSNIFGIFQQRYFNKKFITKHSNQNSTA